MTKNNFQSPNLEKSPYWIKTPQTWKFLSNSSLLSLSYPSLTQKNFYPKTRKSRTPQKEKFSDLPDGDIIHGKRIFDAKCGYCHGLSKIGIYGPSLKNVFLKKVGYHKGFRYTPKLISRKVFWTREEIFNFLREPIQEKEYTNMLTDSFDPWDSLCVIEYLIFLKSVSKSKDELGETGDGAFGREEVDDREIRKFRKFMKGNK